MRKPALRIGSAALALVAGLAATHAAAQEGQAAGAQENERGDEIIVTAQKREEAILDIPQSVTVVSGETLERQHATTFQDYVSQVPGLSMQQSEPGAARLVLRGVNTGGVASTVAVYLDETPFGSSSGLVNGAVLAGDFDTFDVSRVEVLRGPQGTLYGASSLGGVLKFVTNAPQLDTFAVRARGGVEFVDEGGTGYNANGVVNVPLGDIAAVRATGFYRKRAGWVDAIAGDADFLGVPSIGDQDINESEVWGGRASLLVQPTDQLSIRLTGVAQDIESAHSSLVDVDDDYDPINEEMTQSVFIRSPNTLEYRLLNGTVEYDFGFASLLSSTSWAKQDQSYTDDLTQLYGTLINLCYGPIFLPIAPSCEQRTTDVIGMYQDQETNLSKFTQEVRLVSSSNDTFEWLIGAYYTREKGAIDQHFTSRALASGEPFADAVLTDLGLALSSSRYREIAGFANATLHLTDRFDITAGGRISENKQSLVQDAAGAPILVGAGSDSLTEDSKESVFTYSVSPRFELSDTTAVYARVAKGYRPGGPNILAPEAPDELRSYDADTLTSYEVGLKSDIGRRLSLDVSAYHLKWKDIQLFAFINNYGLNANGTGAEINGIEASLQFRPVMGLSFGLNGSVIDAELTGDTDPFVGGFEGDKLPYVPKTSFSASGDYEWALSGEATAFVGGTLAYVGKQRGNFEGGEVVGVDPDTGEFIFAFTDQQHIPDYATVDLRAGAQFGAFTLEAFVRNLTNSRGVTSVNDFTDEVTGASVLRASFIQPRTIGVTLGAEF
jgi:outer membrane receptor protein involved in Fe transport